MTTLKCDGLWQRDSLYLWSDKEHNEKCHSVYPGTSIDTIIAYLFTSQIVTQIVMKSINFPIWHPLHHPKSTYTCWQMCEVLRGDVSVAHAGHAGHAGLCLQHGHHCSLLLIRPALSPVSCVVTLLSRHWSLRWPASNWAPCSSLTPAARPGTNRSGSQLYSHGGPWWSQRPHRVWHSPCAAYNLKLGKQIKTSNVWW